MNDNDKFKKFFGFGGDEEPKEAIESATEQPKNEQNEVNILKGTIADWTDKYITLTADFQNYKKRVSQERADWAQDAQKQVILDILEVIDNFERALEQEKKREDNHDSSWLTGFEMIYQSLEKILSKYGVQPITDFSVFNPKYHEALMQVESAEHESGTIVRVLQKGYMMHDKVIRPATVSIAQ